MTKDRLIQGIALVGLIGGTAVCGSVLPGLTEMAQRHMLRYTDVAVEGAPPVVALGTAIGALRGIIVDYLWIKVQLMKQEGLYYEVMADSDLITQLQPRFSAVWAFHGHNMAYNISVAHNTQEERWEWVKAGIDLVRNKGLRYNPNDLQLHRELAFWFAHKIEGISDDAHLYYKRELAREWHGLLGEPPFDHEARVAWMKKVADAPASEEEAERTTPGVKALVERLNEELAPYERQMKFTLDSRFLKAYSEWQALKQQSKFARIFQFEQKMRGSPLFVTFDEIASDPGQQEAWNTLLAHVRKRVLLDEYNMDPQLMYEYTRDYGPIDWRHGQAHALFWVVKGSEHGEDRVALSEDDIYRVVNNDRMKLQAMQGLARWGRISFDPFSTDWVSRFPDPRWIEVIDRYWEELSLKHEHTRGPGPDLFKAFHENFLSSSVRELYRSGLFALAQRYLDRLNFLYGTNNPSEPNIIYSLPLDIFVRKKLEGEIEMQPHIAPSEVAASLRSGFLMGYGQASPHPETFRRALDFADYVTDYFKLNNYNYFVTKMGSARLGALIGQLDNSVYTVFAQLMIDTTVGMDRRLTMWGRVPDVYKVPIYDDIYPHLRMQFEGHPFGQVVPVEEAFPPPAGLEEYRRLKGLQEAPEQETGEGAGERSEIDRR
jgi:hypothetical protein